VTRSIGMAKIGRTVCLLAFFLAPVLAAGPLRAAEKAPKNDGPNILYLWIDTLRADHLGCYGYQRETSPNIDRLASEGVVFENAYTPHTVTLSSFMSISTSLYPFSHGVLFVAKDRLSPQVKTLPEILKMYGYRNVWYGPQSDPHLAPEVGFGRGFDERHVFVNDLSVARQQLLDTLDSLKGEKFFLNVHTYHVHAPYTPGEEYRYRFTEHKELGLFESRAEIKKAALDSIREAVVDNRGEYREYLGDKAVNLLAESGVFNREEGNLPDKVRSLLAANNLVYKYDDIVDRTYGARLLPDNPEIMTYAGALYDAGILEFDREIVGPLVQKLKEMGVYDKTLIVIIADHGEEFGEHGGITHGKTLYEEVVHIPWVMKIPGLGPKRIAALAESVDFMPTILGELGIPVPHIAQGYDFTPYLKGETRESPRKYVYGQMPRQISLRTGRWKIQFFHGSDNLPGMVDYLKRLMFSKKELFDLESDPREEHNLFNENPQKYNELFAIYQSWEDSLPRYQDTTYEFQPNIDKRTQEKIKKDGYW